MIVDCFTHTWESADQLGRCIPSSGGRGAESAEGGIVARAGAGRHVAAAEPIGTTLVLGFRSRYLDANITNDHVASYVETRSDRMIGFAGVDPSEPKEAIAELHRAREELGLLGIAVAPAAQDFHPSDSQAMQVYAESARLKMPVVFHSGVFISTATKLEYARPVLLDEIARELPELKLVIAHLGYPWVSETLVLLAKHKNVFAETSWLLQQPWKAYQALLSAAECGVMHKLLFGSGFPHAAASHCIEALYSINHLVHGTNLPTIPREALRGIVERDALALLGIPGRGARPQLQASPAIPENDPTTT